MVTQEAVNLLSEYIDLIRRSLSNYTYEINRTYSIDQNIKELKNIDPTEARLVSNYENANIELNLTIFNHKNRLLAEYNKMVDLFNARQYDAALDQEKIVHGVRTVLEQQSIIKQNAANREYAAFQRALEEYERRNSTPVAQSGLTDGQFQHYLRFDEALSKDLSRFDSIVKRMDLCLDGLTTTEYEESILKYKNYIHGRSQEIIRKNNDMVKKIKAGQCDYNTFLSIGKNIADMITETDRNGHILYGQVNAGFERLRQSGYPIINRDKSGNITSIKPDVNRSSNNQRSHSSRDYDYPSSYQPTPQPSPSVSRDSSSDRDDWRSSRDYNPDDRTRVDFEGDRSMNDFSGHIKQEDDNPLDRTRTNFEGDKSMNDFCRPRRECDDFWSQP